MSAARTTMGDRVRAILAPLAAAAREHRDWDDAVVVFAEPGVAGELTMRHCRDAEKLLEEMKR